MFYTETNLIKKDKILYYYYFYLGSKLGLLLPMPYNQLFDLKRLVEKFVSPTLQFNVTCRGTPR